MQATVVDLRYRMSRVIRALERNEDVEILYRGRRKGILKALAERTPGKVDEHPFFNLRSGGRSVAATMAKLRGGRHRAL
jgi:hypothetical protein